MPTLEPRFEGFTKQGKPMAAAMRRSTADGARRHSARRTTACSTMGRPCARKMVFIVTLSIPTAEASTPAPT